MSGTASVNTTTAGDARRGMSLWRLERLRLLRTHRWLILFGAYAAFGVLGPLTARFIRELFGRAGGEITIIAPDPRPVDGIIQFVTNAGQLGLLAVVVVAAGAFAFDAHPQRAAFLRTRSSRPDRLVVAPYVVTTVATVLALLAGTALATLLTTLLIGPLPTGALVVGTTYGALYLGFVVAVVAAAAGVVRTQIATVFLAVGVLLALPVVAMLDVVRPWAPSELLLAVVGMVEGAPASDYARAAGTSVVATVVLLLFAARRLGRREL